MEATITLKDLLQILLYVAGIGALVYLALLLKNVVDVIKGVKKKLDQHEAVIDNTMEKIPGLTDDAATIAANAAQLTTETTDLVEAVKPEIEKVAITVGTASETVDDLVRSVDDASHKISDTVNVVTDSVSNTARTISINAENIFDYFYILKEVFAAMLEFVQRRARN